MHLPPDVLLSIAAQKQGIATRRPPSPSQTATTTTGHGADATKRPQAHLYSAKRAAVLLPPVMPVFASQQEEAAQMRKRAEAAFGRYHTGGTPLMSEDSFCAFMAHLAAIHGLRALTHEQAARLYASIAPSQQLDLDAFSSWLVANYRSLYQPS